MQIILENYIPPPKERPRKSKGKSGHFYSPSAPLEEQLARILWYEVQRINITSPPLPWSFPCLIKIQLFHDKKHAPSGDIDNIAKFVMDAIQKAKIIENDKLFHHLYISRNPSPKVGTVITIQQLIFYEQFPLLPAKDDLSLADSIGAPIAEGSQYWQPQLFSTKG